jgi:hypothetical protein
VPINDPRSTDATAYDQIVISGTDTRVGVAADPIGNQSFEQYLAGQHATVLQGTNSADCKGSDPSTWANVTVGDREGRVMVLCNFEVVFVQVGDRVFQFTWGHDTFTPARHLPLSGFQELLTTVVFGPPPNPAASATR